MGLFGKILGNIAGGLGSKFAPLPGVNGAEVGGAIGGLLPFAKGGYIPGKKNKAKVILGHSGEFVIPTTGPRPTKAQKAYVKKLRSKKK